MAHLLHLDSSISGARSRSRMITAAFAEEWLAAGNTVTYRDLAANPPTPMPDSELHWAPELRKGDGMLPAAESALKDELLAELLAADVLLVAAPLYNYSLPSILKAWIEYVHIPGSTTGPTPPMAGRPAIVVSSRGASYDEGSPTEGWDHGVPVLQLVLGTAMGMQLEVITTNLTLADYLPALAEQQERSDAELAAAIELARARARALTA